MLVEAGRHWRYRTPAKFCISFAAYTTTAKCNITNRRLGIARSERVDDPEWTGHEDGIWFCETRFIAGNYGAKSSNGLLIGFSLHAIARWYQRSGRTSDAELMADMNVVANLDLAKLERGGGVKITTDTDGVGWRGQLAMVEDGAMKHRVVTVRTWLEN